MGWKPGIAGPFASGRYVVTHGSCMAISTIIPKSEGKKWIPKKKNIWVCLKIRRPREWLASFWFPFNQTGPSQKVTPSFLPRRFLCESTLLCLLHHLHRLLLRSVFVASPLAGGMFGVPS